MPMQPSPSADTNSPDLPSSRVCISTPSLIHSYSSLGCSGAECDSSILSLTARQFLGRASILRTLRCHAQPLGFERSTDCFVSTGLSPAPPRLPNALLY